MITEASVNPGTRIKVLADIFAETAVFPKEVANPYLQAGIMSEVGEMMNVAKKVLRGDSKLEDLLPRVIDEYGDVIWYTVSLCRYVDGISESATLYDYEREADAYAGFLAAGLDGDVTADDQFFVEGLLSMCRDLLHAADEWGVHQMLRVIAEMGAHLSHYAKRDVGLAVSSRKVAEKLADRKERGVIRGDGDNR